MRMTRQLLILLAAAIASLAADQLPVRDLVARAAEQYEARKSLAANFTHAESIRNQNLDSHGKKTLDISDTFEVIILEGAPYYRHTGHNGKPLSPRENQKEDEKMRNVGKQRRAGDRAAGIHPHGVNIALPIARTRSLTDSQSRALRWPTTVNSERMGCRYVCSEARIRAESG